MSKEKRKWKSRTLSLTDEEWATIHEVAIRRGFGEKGRGKAIVQISREEIARLDRRVSSS